MLQAQSRAAERTCGRRLGLSLERALKALMSAPKAEDDRPEWPAARPILIDPVVAAPRVALIRPRVALIRPRVTLVPLVRPRVTLVCPRITLIGASVAAAVLWDPAAAAVPSSAAAAPTAAAAASAVAAAPASGRSAVPSAPLRGLELLSALRLCWRSEDLAALFDDAVQGGIGRSEADDLVGTNAGLHALDAQDIRRAEPDAETFEAVQKCAPRQPFGVEFLLNVVGLLLDFPPITHR